MYGLITAFAAAVIVLFIAMITRSWLGILAKDWQEDRIEQAGKWAAEKIAEELLYRETVISLMTEAWKRSPDQSMNFADYFRPLYSSELISAAFIYDVDIPDISYQVLPEFSIPIPESRASLLNRVQSEFGASRLEAKNPDNLWMFLGPLSSGEPAAALFISRLDNSRFLVSEYQVEAPLRRFVRDPWNNDVTVTLLYENIAIFHSPAQTGEYQEGGEAPLADFNVRLNSQPTYYTVRMTLGSNDRVILLNSLTRLISAGGAMFALAIGCLVIAWTRSSKRFTVVKHKQRLLHDRSPLFYHDIDHELRITDVNQTECEALGYLPGELVGKRIGDLLAGADGLLENLKRPDPNESSLRASANYRAANGELIPVNITAVTDVDEHGRIRWMMIAQDMTEQTRVERLSARSQLQVRFLSKVVESLEDGLLVLDEMGCVIYANPAATGLADPSYQGLLGRTLNEIFAIPPSVDFWQEIIDHARSNLGWHAELGLIGDQPDKVRLSVRLSGASGRETGGSAIILLVRDLTKEKELSRQLASSQRMYQLIFDKAPTGIIVLDENGSIVGANNFHHERLSPSLPRGMTSLFDHPALLRAGGREALARLYNGEEIMLDQVAFPGRSGDEKRYLSIHGIPASEGSAEGVTRAFLFVEDITERVELERRREQHTLSLEDEKERALEASRLKSHFIATISHELRTPLNAILGFSQLIAKKSVLDDRQSGNLSKIEDSGRKLLRLVNDLLDISRIEAGHMQIHWEPVVLGSFFEDIQRQTESLMEQNGNTVRFSIPADIGVLDTDSFRLQQILMNLINNAAKFTQNGHVEISAEVIRVPEAAEEIVITVADTGLGIPQSKLEDIFDEFYQVDGSATRAYGGTGLGLAISRKLAILMSGDITAESKPGEGSIFRLRLPRSRGARQSSGDSTPLLKQSPTLR